MAFKARKPRIRAAQGYVYFIAPEALLHRPEFDEGRVVKIGYTKADPLNRLKSLQTGSPLILKLWAYTEGGIELERAFHEAFSPLAMHGEWFFAEHKLFDLMIHLGEEPNTGNFIPYEKMDAIMHDAIFTDCVPHPAVPEKEWLGSTRPECLAGYYPNAWREAKEWA